MREIRFVIDPEGQIEIDAVGFAGKDCLKVTRSLEHALGAQEENRIAKSEMHQSSTRTGRIGS